MQFLCLFVSLSVYVCLSMFVSPISPFTISLEFRVPFLIKSDKNVQHTKENFLIRFRTKFCLHGSVACRSRFSSLACSWLIQEYIFHSMDPCSKMHTLPCWELLSISSLDFVPIASSRAPLVPFFRVLQVFYYNSQVYVTLLLLC